MSLTFKEFKSLMLNIPKELLVFGGEPLFHFYYACYKTVQNADGLNSISLDIANNLVGDEYEFYKKLGVYFTMMGIKYLKC